MSIFYPIFLNIIGHCPIFLIYCGQIATKTHRFRISLTKNYFNSYILKKMLQESKNYELNILL